MAVALETKWNTRLRDSIDHSRRQLAPFRQQRNEVIKQFVGKHYGQHGSSEHRPVNFMELSVNIYMFNLAARPPRLNVSTRYPELKPVASGLTLGINEFLKRINAGRVLREFVMDAMFGFGIMKVGLADEDFVELDGEEIGIGSAFMDTVSLDDFVYDTDARTYDAVRYAGNKYMIRKNHALESGLYDNKVLEEYCSSWEARAQNEDGGERASMLTTGSSLDYDTEDPLIELMDIWIPDDNVIITMPAETGQDMVLRESEYEGPQTGARSQQGPYHLLRFNPVPDNIYPLPPVMIWRDLDDLANKLMRKMNNQAVRQKEVTGVRTGSERDGRNIQSAQDGQMISLDDPQSATIMKFGGVDATTQAFFLNVKEMINYIGGNLDSLGGLSKQADTLGQEEMIAASSALRIQSMQMELHQAMTQIMRSLCWYVVTDPMMELPYTRRLQGMEDIEVASSIRASDMQGDFLDYNFEIEPYSMQPQTPQQKAMMLQQILSQFYMPALPFLEQQGLQVDWHMVNKLLSEYSSLPELELVIRAADEDEMGDRPTESHERVNPTQTTRKYLREGRPGGTRSTQDNALARTLMGESLQDDETSRIATGGY